MQLIFLIPLLLFVFTWLLQGQQYMFVSVLLLLVILMMCFMRFEHRKPRARDIVTLAVMTSFCVISNEICSHTIPLHAGTAMVVLTGVAFGAEAGFLVGALSRLLCNFFAGQGPWTPWQMAAWGALGCLAGILFHRVENRNRFEEEEKGRRLIVFREAMTPAAGVITAWLVAYIVYLFTGSTGESFFGWRLYAYGGVGLLAGWLLQRRRLPADGLVVAVFTFIIVFLLYGGIMNFAAMMMQYQGPDAENTISLEALRALYLTGVPYDISHAAAAAFCVLLFGDSILQKLNRVKIKYGLLAYK